MSTLNNTCEVGLNSSPLELSKNTNLNATVAITKYGKNDYDVDDCKTDWYDVSSCDADEDDIHEDIDNDVLIVDSGSAAMANSDITLNNHMFNLNMGASIDQFSGDINNNASKQSNVSSNHESQPGQKVPSNNFNNTVIEEQPKVFEERLIYDVIVSADRKALAKEFGKMSRLMLIYDVHSPNITRTYQGMVEIGTLVEDTLAADNIIAENIDKIIECDIDKSYKVSDMCDLCKVQKKIEDLDLDADFRNDNMSVHIKYPKNYKPPRAIACKHRFCDSCAQILKKCTKACIICNEPFNAEAFDEVYKRNKKLIRDTYIYSAHDIYFKIVTRGEVEGAIVIWEEYYMDQYKGNPEPKEADLTLGEACQKIFMFQYMMPAILKQADVIKCVLDPTSTPIDIKAHYKKVFHSGEDLPPTKIFEWLSNNEFVRYFKRGNHLEICVSNVPFNDNNTFEQQTKEFLERNPHISREEIVPSDAYINTIEQTLEANIKSMKKKRGKRKCSGKTKIPKSIGK
jgi:hypothetical protein